MVGALPTHERAEHELVVGIGPVGARRAGDGVRQREVLGEHRLHRARRAAGVGLPRNRERRPAVVERDQPAERRHRPVAQGPLLGRGARAATAWAAVDAGTLGLGWLITSQVIVDAERGYHMFGASGALAATVLTGSALRALVGAAPPSRVSRVAA